MYKRYNDLNSYYQNLFNSKVFKISLNGGFTCPNRDGTKGIGGCIYCSSLGSGEFAGNKDLEIEEQFKNVLKTYQKKWPKGKYIAYFQANTNTYAPLDILKEKYERALKCPNVIGLAIATRADSISDEVIDYLDELNKRTYLIIELGLQTIHDKTAKLINRCHSLDCFKDMVLKLKKRNIKVVVHIINGLPYETKNMMLETISYLNNLGIDGIKIHMLHIIKDTKLEALYKKEKFHILSKEEYVDIVTSQLENLDPKIVIHRLTGDPDKKDLVEPKWTLKKFDVLNSIDKLLREKHTYQGFNLNVDNKVHQLMDLVLRKRDIVINMSNDTYIDKFSDLIVLDDIDIKYKNKISFIYVDNKKIDVNKYYEFLNDKGILVIKNKDNLIIKNKKES